MADDRSRMAALVLYVSYTTVDVMLEIGLRVRLWNMDYQFEDVLQCLMSDAAQSLLISQL